LNTQFSNVKWTTRFAPKVGIVERIKIVYPTKGCTSEKKS